MAILNDTLHNSKVKLRRWCLEDSDFIFELRSDKKVNFYLDRTPPKGKKEIVLLIDDMILGMESKWYSWIIFDLQQSIKVGSICLWNFSLDRKSVELGYEVISKYQNRGYVTSAIDLVLKFGFHRLRCHTIIANTAVTNVPSKQLLGKIGFNLKSSQELKSKGLNSFELSYENYMQLDHLIPISLDQKLFSAESNSAGGDVEEGTVFHYRQKEDIIWATYEGGGIAFGTLSGERFGTHLFFQYQHRDINGVYKTGECRSEILVEGSKLKLIEYWQWTNDQKGIGNSILNEL